MTTQALETQALGDGFAAQRSLFEAAAYLARQLARMCDYADRLQLGSSCMSIAAHAALAARSEREALRNWRECALAERQIRAATARALGGGYIGSASYDLIFDLAAAAARARQDEVLRLRRRLQRLNLI
jgi:hypothetical protein